MCTIPTKTSTLFYIWLLYCFTWVCCKSVSWSGYVVKVSPYIMKNKIFDWHWYNRFIFALSVLLKNIFWICCCSSQSGFPNLEKAEFPDYVCCSSKKPDCLSNVAWAQQMKWYLMSYGIVGTWVEAHTFLNPILLRSWDF